MIARNHVQFVLNDRDISLSHVGPNDTLLDFIRNQQRLTGTKEGCAEGDCGACTVMVGRLEDGELRYQPVNACIQFLASVDGCHVVTVEHISGADGGLHPVQQAMVAHHGSQCGFCTPGIVMALYALWMGNPAPTEPEIETALQGNLCRCTGYAPIIRAAQAAAEMTTQGDDPLNQHRAAITARLTALADGARVTVARGEDRCILPASVDDLADILLETPEATIVAGATDVGLWVTKFLRDISPMVYLGHLAELRRINVTDDAIILGAGVSYTDSQTVLTADYPHLTTYWNRIAGWQVRNAGTVGGNVANGSPIGDTPPVLIALGAEITLRRGTERRTMPVEAFFIEYGKQDRAEGEFLESLSIPRPRPNSLHAAYKISKRRDEDISSSCAAFNMTVQDGVITDARIAFGGMAGVPKRATHAEAALIDQPMVAASFQAAADCLPQDFAPLSDWRASAGYRMQVSQNLFRRFWLEQGGGDAPVRLSA